MIRREHVAAIALILGSLSACSREPRPVGAGRGDPGAAPPSAAARAESRVLEPARFADPQTRAAYAAAARYAALLEGVYCHCHCRENIGHRALIECFESEHGANCDICQTEALIAARMGGEGRSVAEIQRAIDAYYQQG